MLEVEFGCLLEPLLKILPIMMRVLLLLLQFVFSIPRKRGIKPSLEDVGTLLIRTP